MPLADFCRLMSQRSGVSIILSESLDNRTVTVEVRDQPVSQVLGGVARRAGVQVARVGDLFFLGELRREDRGLLVRRVRRLSADDIRAAVATLQSEHGASAVYSDGLVTIGDRVEVLARLSEMFDQVEAADSPTWVVQLYILSLSASDARELAIDSRPALDVSLAFATSSATVGTLPATSASLNGGLDAVLSYARDRGREAIIAEPLFLMQDGSQARQVRGSRVPIPRRVVSDQGTVTTEGYDYEQTGLIVEVDLREQSQGIAALDLVAELSEITGFVEAAPITTQERVETRVCMASGGVYLVAASERMSKRDETRLGLSFGDAVTTEARQLQVWARACRVAGPAVAPARSECEHGGGRWPEIERLPPID